MWRKLHIEGLTALYSLPNIIQSIKSRIKWTGYLARLRVEERCIQGFGGET